MDRPSTRRRVVLGLIALVALIAGPLATYQLTLTAPRGPALIVADLAVGWSMIAAGLIICDRRPGNLIGPLAVAAGFAWFAGDLASATSAPLAYLAAVFHGWFDPLFAILILAYPTGRLLRPVDRWLAVGFIVVQGAWTLTKAYALRPIAWWQNPTSPDTVDAWITARGAMDTLGRIETAALTALSLGLLVAVAVRWQRASGAARRRQAPVVFAGIVLVLGLTGQFVQQTVAPIDARSELGELRVAILAVLRVLVAVALLVGILRDEAARGRIATLVVRLDGLPSTAALQDSLRDALGDPSLEVFRWVDGRNGFEDAAGAVATPPPDGPTRSTLTIDTDAGPALAIAFDPVLRDDPGLVSAAVAAVRLSVENERLQAEVRAQLDAVQASRARLVDAQDAERRRMERDLHDGAQQRLVSLRISLELLRRKMGPDADPDALIELDAASADARAAIDELRELARGLHPAILAEGGLRPALASLAERSPVPTTLTAQLDGPIPPAVEATVYFVVAEALTNTAKYANARTAAIHASQADARLRIEVSDDGRGGADPATGTGLRGLEDRVAAVGGTMRVISPPGGGTTIAVDLPCASS